MAVDDRRREHRRALQVASWRGRSDVAVMSPAPGGPDPDHWPVADELGHLRALGVQRVLTSALHRHEVPPFLASGFTLREELHLLRHDLIDLPAPTLGDHGTDPAGAPRLRRARRRDIADVLAIDEAAFDTFWNLDRAGLSDAVRATPVARFRVARPRRGPVSAYAITGRAGDRGYLQRLAVDPGRHRHGIGRAMVADGLWWLRRSGARLALVNTQHGNDGALSLYLACGFRLETHGLSVLELDLDQAAPT